MKKIFISLIFPTLTLAQTFNLANSTFEGIVREILGIISMLFPLLASLAVVVFFWGLAKFLLNSNSKVEIEAGKNYMFWGVIALFVLISFNVIVDVIANNLLGIGRADQSTVLLPSS